MITIESIKSACEAATNHIQAIEAVNSASLPYKTVFFVEGMGKKYTRVIRDAIDKKTGEFINQRSVWCFIDQDGNILKGASWKAPAKNFTRGTIADFYDEKFIIRNQYGF